MRIKKKECTNMKLAPVLLMGLNVLALSACSKEPRPEDLPPGPIGGPGAGGPGGPGTNQVLPGSHQDFLANVMSDRVFFDTNRSDIDPEDKQVLETQLTWLMRYPATRIVIEGHCDERGTRDYNIALGARRANAAKNYLVARGINPARIQTVSYGKERPEAMGSDAESWARNRRAVTITIQ
jgi:peptidoglycan-associated lipoprotein